MADLITVHHPKLRLEAHHQTREALETWMADKGWREGPLPPQRSTSKKKSSSSRAASTKKEA